MDTYDKKIQDYIERGSTKSPIIKNLYKILAIKNAQRAHTKKAINQKKTFLTTDEITDKTRNQNAIIVVIEPS